MGKFFRDLVTEKDGHTFELQRTFLFCSGVIAIIAFVWGCTLESIHVYRTGEFDLPAFFQGIAYLLAAETILLGGGGASIFWKAKTENADGGTQFTQTIKTEKTTNAQL